jgi:thioredoxin 1
MPTDPILDKLTADPKFRNLKIFRVDFDAMKPVVRQFGAQMQSTLIVFKGAAETGRSVGDTQEASIAALLDKSL